MARQALEMALGRGGDQAAVKTRNGFDFTAGYPRGGETHQGAHPGGRFRPAGADDGQRQRTGDGPPLFRSGLPGIGSAMALAAARGLGKPAYAVVRRKTTLAGELIRRFDEGGRATCSSSRRRPGLVNRKTLLIITDTHNPQMLEDQAVPVRFRPWW